MPKYVLLETEQWEIGDHPEFSGDAHKARLFGDVIELPEDMANRAILEGAAILPQSDFDALGFTAADIEKYPNKRTQTCAPKAWLDKHLAGRIALHNLRIALRTKAETAAQPAAEEA